MDNKSKQNLYIVIINIVAFSVLFIIYNESYNYDSLFFIKDSYNIYNFLLWVVLAIIAESFLIISPSTGATTSVAPAIYIYIILVSNPYITMVIIMLASLLKFPEYDGERKHLFNAKKSAIFFNVATFMLSMGIAGIIIHLYTGNNYAVLTAFIVLSLLCAEFVNYILFATLLKINQNVQPIQVFRSMIKTFPSTIAIGSLGLLLAIADATYDPEIVLVFFIPLLLARYSFKLYFESQRMALDTIHALNEALHAKDAYTGSHTGRVEQYSVQLAEAYGLSHSDCEIIRTAALLHDIGKIGIPDDVLNKPGRLTRDEFEMIQEHSSIGAKILGNVNSLKKVSSIIVQHHERFDGKGYPSKLKGEEISIEASILMISDSYDAMTSDRPYRPALTKENAISELEKFSGSQFHPLLAKTFVDKVLRVEVVKEQVLQTDAEILEKTKEIIEANSDLPQEVLEFTKAEDDYEDIQQLSINHENGNWIYNEE